MQSYRPVPRPFRKSIQDRRALAARNHVIERLQQLQVPMRLAFGFFDVSRQMPAVGAQCQASSRRGRFGN